MWLAPLAILWLGLIRQLSVEWSLNPQYTYGWAVPPLCVLLLFFDLRNNRSHSRLLPQIHFPRRLVCLAAVILFAYGLTRLAQEANPDWRLVSWLLALEVTGLTLLTWKLLMPASVPVFPILFFLTAVPWPTLLEAPTIHFLTNTVVAATAEVLGWIGIPAVPRGNVIELGSGLVGIEDACSGIRSLQASLMVALFVGQVYSLTWAARSLCLGAAVGLALLGNLARTILLTVLAATKGPTALPGWHDAAGTLILTACFLAMWLAATRLRSSRCSDPFSTRQKAAGAPTAPCRWFSSDRFARTALFPVVALVWIAIVEFGTNAWYGSRERHLPAPVTWHIVPPRDQTAYRELPFSMASRRILRFDRAINAAWTDERGLPWQAIFLQWNPARTAARLARNHTPADCLSASGLQPAAQSTLLSISVRELELPFRSYAAHSDGGPLRVFYCLWEDRAAHRDFNSEDLTYRQRLFAILAGQRNSGQRSLEVAIWGALTEQEAITALQALLDKIVEVDR
ncbi:MAG TPA: exosortase/archaeosortase family protein [Verrucomicrobiae bacterium]|nr:exosortase/archaeosortase family protein [Verrucomicrobiae bacterium]